MFKKILKGLMFFVLGILVIWVLAVQAGCFSMRITDQEWAEKLLKEGQTIKPLFFDVQAEGGRRIHAIEVSASDSLPLTIMVHGSPGGAVGYLKYLSDTVLTRMSRMVAFDRPGFGFTSGFGDPEPSQEAQAAAVKVLADALSPGRKVFLIGHSLGGPVVARFAMDYPELTAGLVIVAGAIDPSQEENPWWRAIVNTKTLRWMTPRPLWASNAELIPLEKELEKMLPLWSKITCPIRMIHAENDHLVPIANVDFAKRMIKNSVDLQFEILPEGGHFILWTRHDLIREGVMELFRG